LQDEVIVLSLNGDPGSSSNAEFSPQLGWDNDLAF
jgi:hypothetical protein